MANTFEIIKDSLVGLFKGLYPNFPVFFDEPGQAQQDGLEDYICIDIIPTGNTTVSTYDTDRRMLIDVAIHERSEDNSKYLNIIGTVDGALRPVFRFADRAITIPTTEYRIVDRILHCTFGLNFSDGIEPPGGEFGAELKLNTERK